MSFSVICYSCLCMPARRISRRNFFLFIFFLSFFLSLLLLYCTRVYFVLVYCLRKSGMFLRPILAHVSVCVFSLTLPLEMVFFASKIRIRERERDSEGTWYKFCIAKETHFICIVLLENLCIFF